MFKEGQHVICINRIGWTIGNGPEYGEECVVDKEVGGRDMNTNKCQGLWLKGYNEKGKHGRLAYSAQEFVPITLPFVDTEELMNEYIVKTVEV